MSEGIRSGVNCTRSASSPMTIAERLDQLGLGEAGHADQKAVPAREQSHQRLLDDLLLAEDHGADRCPRRRDARERRFGSLGVRRLASSSATVIALHCRMAVRARRAFRFAARRTRLTGIRRRGGPSKANVRVAAQTTARLWQSPEQAPEEALAGLREAKRPAQARPCACSPVESALLRRDRHAHRRRRNVVLLRLADRPAAAGPAFRLDPAQGRGPPRPGHPGRTVGINGRRRAVPRRRDERAKGTETASACRSAPMSKIS